MRRCGRCEREQAASEFYAGQRWCKECLKSASGAALRRRRARAKQFLLDHLLEHPCVDCGEGDPVVLEFDHLRDKTKDLTALAHDGVTPAVLEAEIAKCDVVCAVCHWRRTNLRSAQIPPAARAATVQRNIAFVREALASAMCADCGRAEPDVLEFDHRGPKTASVMHLAWSQASLDRLLAEIARCDIRCTNCHRRRTAREGRHYRYVAIGKPL